MKLMAERRPDNVKYQRELAALRLEHAADVYGHAQTYDNVILLAGYAAFFGLWAGVADDVSSVCRLATVGMMGVSLAAYIAWHMIQMLNRQRWEHKQADALLDLADEPERLDAELKDIKAKWAASFLRAMRTWYFLFAIAVGFGFLGALTLMWNAIALALGLPLELVG